MSFRNHYFFEDKENLCLNNPEKVQGSMGQQNAEKNFKYQPDRFEER